MATPATLANLLAQMNQDQECLNGWDAVMNLLEDDVNKFFLSQWNLQTGNTNKLSVSQIWCEGVDSIHGQYFTNVTQIDFVLGPPLFKFASGQSEVTVTQDILSGTVKTGTLDCTSSYNPLECGCPVNDPSVDWTATHQVPTNSPPASITGTVALEQVQGIVSTNTNSLLLDFSKGAFSTDLTVQGVKDTDIVDQLKDWFGANKIRYILASVDFQNSSNAGLTPTSFEFYVKQTDAGNTVVQLLMTTDGTQPTSTVINVDEPVPTASNLTCSLMVSSRVVYNSILVPGFNGHGAAFQLVPQAPPSALDCWSAYISPEMHFAGSFSFGSCCDRTTVTYSIYLGGTYTGSQSTGFHLSQHVHTSGNAPVDITVSANYPVALSGTGPNQEFTIHPQTPSVTVTGSVESQIKSGLQSILSNDLAGAMAGISFTPVTYLALKSLLFPGNLIKMSEAQMPGDLLIVGTFEPT